MRWQIPSRSKNLIARYLDEQILERIAGEYRRGERSSSLPPISTLVFRSSGNIGAIADSDTRKP